MNSLLLFSLVATILSAVAVGIYWCAVYPILRLKLRFALRQIQDEMRLRAIAGELPSESKIFMKLEKLLRAAVSVSEHISEFSWLPSGADSKQERFEIAALLEELEDAPKEIREIGREIINRTFALYLSQRPFAFVGVAALTVAALISVSAKQTLQSWLSKSVAATTLAAEPQPIAA